MFTHSFRRIFALITTLSIFLVHPLDADQTGKEVKPKGQQPTLVQYAAPDSGPVTRGELSIGKFYMASREPDRMYPDSWPNQWTLGTRLTDEHVGRSGEDFDKNTYVGWRGAEPVEITVDLGRPQKVQKIYVSGSACAESYFLLPEGAVAATSLQREGPWEKFGASKAPESKDEVRYPYEMEISGATRLARFVKITVQPSKETVPSSFLLLDGIRVMGEIQNTAKYVPVKGAFHGAFPTSVGHTVEEKKGRSGMVIDLFEKLVGKKIAMVLWYQAMEPGRNFDEIQKLRKNLTKDFEGSRFFCLGWLPKGKLDVIATGKFDDFLTQYFRDSIDPKLTEGMDFPIFFRPMNEFNGGWVPYGLEPETFRQAWRRMYNIAEQVGATEQHVFVWAPNHRSYPNEDWNKMEVYWPGDQYVDWVGVSAYPPSKKFIKDLDRQYPVGNIKEVYEKYSSFKPLMIAEGGFSNEIDRVRWVREWFEGIKEEYPKVHALIWENHNQRVISRDPEALKLYRELVQDPYWLDSTVDGEKPFAQ